MNRRRYRRGRHSSSGRRRDPGRSRTHVRAYCVPVLPDRRRLLDEMVRRTAEDVRKRLEAARISDVAPEERLTGVVRVCLETDDAFVGLARDDTVATITSAFLEGALLAEGTGTMTGADSGSRRTR